MTNQDYQGPSIQQPSQHPSEATRAEFPPAQDPQNELNTSSPEYPDTSDAKLARTPWYASKLAKITGVGAAVASGIAIGYSLQENGSSSPEEIEAVEQAEEPSDTLTDLSDDSEVLADDFRDDSSPSSEDGTVERPDTEDTNEDGLGGGTSSEELRQEENDSREAPTEEGSNLYSPEVINPDNEPTLLTADTSEELLEQYMQNRSCMLNADNLSLESICLEALYGNTLGAQRDVGVARDWISGNKEYARRMRDGRAERGEDPFYVKLGWEQVDSWEEGGVLTIQAKINSNWDPINHPANETVTNALIRFEQSTTSAEDMASFGQDQTVWVVRGNEEIIGTDDL